MLIVRRASAGTGTLAAGGLCLRQVHRCDPPCADSRKSLIQVSHLSTSSGVEFCFTNSKASSTLSSMFGDFSCGLFLRRGIGVRDLSCFLLLLRWPLPIPCPLACPPRLSTVILSLAFPSSFGMYVLWPVAAAGIRPRRDHGQHNVFDGRDKAP